MQRLPEMEKTVMNLAQNVMRVLQSLEETQNAMAALSLGRVMTTTAQWEDHAKWIPGVGETSGNWIAVDETRWSGNGEWHGERQLEMPIFMGENPDDWIFRVDRYFAMYGLMEYEKLVTTAMSSDGDALSWCQWTGSRETFRSWENWRDDCCFTFVELKKGGFVSSFLWCDNRGQWQRTDENSRL